MSQDDARIAYPLDWEEQARLFRELPTHLERMALFAVNTGCREREICELRWSWEVQVPELATSVFLIPRDWVKNKLDRMVVLNRTAQTVVEAVRGIHEEYVFTYSGRAVL